MTDPVAAVRSGLPFDAFESVRDALDVPNRLLANVLSISERTLQRRRNEGRFSPEESDRLLLLAEIVRLAVRAFDGIEPARDWLTRSHALLNEESPIEHMDTIAGVEEVETMLYHVEYSMPV